MPRFRISAPSNKPLFRLAPGLFLLAVLAFGMSACRSGEQASPIVMGLRPLPAETARAAITIIAAIVLHIPDTSAGPFRPPRGSTTMGGLPAEARGQRGAGL